LTVVACGDVNVGPVAPEWPDPEPGIRTLQISGELRAEEGSCLEATVLYDGQEAAGARVVCAKARGCATLELAATVRSWAGHHTISFQVLNQSQNAIDYLAEGTVVVDREGISLGGTSLPLKPTHAKLRKGGVVSFEIDLVD
jgi:hypothetical protein